MDDNGFKKISLGNNILRQKQQQLLVDTYSRIFKVIGLGLEPRPSPKGDALPTELANQLINGTRKTRKCY